MAVCIRQADYATSLYPQKLALISSTSGGRSVVSRTEDTEFGLDGKQNYSIIDTVEYKDIFFREVGKSRRDVTSKMF
jgi:hypothetical protein